MNAAEPKNDDKYEAENDAAGVDIPSGVPKDDSYVTSGAQGVAVQNDDAPVEDGVGDPKVANSDEMLGMYLVSSLVRASADDCRTR